ncbi:serine hydrolase domain-containing protein [Sphingobacterium thalpophilum]|uniref:serine hydrolase domain-containing protein n=1 Tax=Sphingobacterium thalpophilum TaxID=259 RepID=UPI0037DA5365
MKFSHKVFIPLLVILLGQCFDVFPQKIAQVPNFKPLESKIQAWIDSGYYKGASVYIAQHNKKLYEHYFGDHHKHTVVFIASAGKWLAAAAIAALVDAGKLSWNDSVRKWLPEFKDVKGDATLMQLMSHTAGYPAYQPEGSPKDIYQNLSESVAEIKNLSADTLPGTRFRYGGLAMNVAGRMAEIATGKDWETIFQEEIAIPLGMKNTFFTPVDSSGGHAPMLGGGARSTLEDYRRFLEMIASDGVFEGKRILSREAIDMMQLDHTSKSEVQPNEFVQQVHGGQRKDIYGLGEWREEVDVKGNAILLSSPSWAGAYPWIDKQSAVYGFFMTHIDTEIPGFNSFLASPVIAQYVRHALAASADFRESKTGKK